MIEGVPNYPDPEVARKAVVSALKPVPVQPVVVLHPDTMFNERTTIASAKRLGLIPDYVLLTRHVPRGMFCTINPIDPWAPSPVWIG